MYAELLQFQPKRRETSRSIIERMQPSERRTAKENLTSSQGILCEDILL
jgi:hypothetical protein